MLAFATITQSSQSKEKDNNIETYMAGIAQGNQDALTRLYEQTHAAVYGFALSILKNKYDAEDVTHDAYIQIWKGAGSYTSVGKPMSWIFTITRNLALMRLREQKRIVEMAPEDWENMFAETPAVDSADRMVLEALLGCLSDEERQIVMLHAMTGLKHREIADILDLRLSNVLSKYNRALKKLRTILLKEVE